MANELQTKLDAILEDKNTNLLPEHLKAGVTCLGVEGEFEGGAQINNQDITINKSGTYTADEGYTGLGTVVANFSGGDTKTFETVEDMYADENPIPDGKALIYRKQKSYIEQNTNFTDIWLPETITLPRAVTSDIQINVSIEHDNGGGGDSPTITPTGVTFNFYMNMSMAYFEYTSTDGITYTRTTAEVSNEDMGWGDYFDWTDDVLSIKSDGEYSDGYHCSYAVVSGDEDLAKEFYARMSYGFHGLYINGAKKDKSKLTRVKNIRHKVVNSTATSVYDKYTIEYDVDYNHDYAPVQAAMTKLKDFLGATSYGLIEVIDDNHYIVYSAKYGSNSYYSDCSPYCFEEFNGDTNWYIGATTSNTISVHSIDVTTSTVKDITSTYTWNTVTIGDTSVKYITTSMSKTHYFTRCYWSYNESDSRDIEPVLTSKTSASGYTGWFIPCGYGNIYEYQPAQTQFTLENKNELLDGVCALGKNGEITGDGSIYSVISINSYLEQKGIDLREGISYLATESQTGMTSDKANKSYLALKYIQCKKIEPVFPDFYQVVSTATYNLWFNPVEKIIAVCDNKNTLLYEYTNDSFKSSDGFKYRLVNDIIYVYTTYSALLIKFGATLDTASVITTLYYYTDTVLLKDTCAYALVKASNTVFNINKISYDGTSKTLTKWTRAGGDSFGYNQLIEKDDILYITANTTNSNYGYLGMINLTDDTVIKSTAYSLQGWILTNSEDNSLVFIQYNNTNANMYSMGIDGTLTSIGTLPYGIYNDTLDTVYYIPYANTVCGFSLKSGVYMVLDSDGTNIGSYSVRQHVSGFSDTSTGGVITPDEVTCENNVMTCTFMYYNYTYKQNYYGTLTLDMNYTMSAEDNRLFPIDNEALSNGFYRKIQLFAPAIGTEYENTISPAEYEEINTMAEDVLGGVE